MFEIEGEITKEFANRCPLSKAPLSQNEVINYICATMMDFIQNKYQVEYKKLDHSWIIIGLCKCTILNNCRYWYKVKDVMIPFNESNNAPGKKYYILQIAQEIIML